MCSHDTCQVTGLDLPIASRLASLNCAHRPEMAVVSQDGYVSVTSWASAQALQSILELRGAHRGA